MNHVSINGKEMSSSSISQLHINEEYQDLVPPLTTQEYNDLKTNIKNNGQHQPIIVSDRTGQFVIIDGHHRYKITQELERESLFEIKHFESETEELEYIRDCNIERRNLNTMQKGMIVLRVKDMLTDIAKKNSQSNLKQNLPSDKYLTVGRVNEKLGNKAGTSHENIRKIKTILKEAPQHIREKALKGQYSVNKAYKSYLNEQRRQEMINAEPIIRLPENTNYKLLFGDILEKGNEIPDNSIDLIFTDPPYAETFLPLYEKLGVLASRVLKPGGSLVTIANYNLLECANLINKSGLKCIHDFAIIHAGRCGIDWKYHIELNHKTALWFVKGDKPNTTSVIKDVINSTPPDKSLHNWAQSQTEAEHIINGLTVDNQVVLDPYMGVGTFGISALKLNRKFIGVEIDSESFKLAEVNISNVTIHMLPQ